MRKVIETLQTGSGSFHERAYRVDRGRLGGRQGKDPRVANEDVRHGHTCTGRRGMLAGEYLI